jgi:site-specific DNA recombinase
MPRKQRVTKRPARPRPAVVGYPRVSTEEQATLSQSIEMQTDKIRDYCRLYELDLIAIHADLGQSGKTLDRPGMHKVISDFKTGRADGVVIYKLDRLTRYLGDWVHMIETYFNERSGYQLFSVSDSVDTRSASGRMVLNMLLVVAQWERETIAERTADALQAKIKRHERCGNVRYGYALDQAGPINPRRGRPLKLETVNHEQKVIQKLKQLRHQGHTYQELVDHLNAMGIETKKGGLWYPSTVRQIITRKVD